MKTETITAEFIDEASKVIVGQRPVIVGLLIALFSEGHVLLEGSPGLGKTLMSKTFSRMVGGSFHRIQMTPDLLPADILGVNIFNPGKSSFTYRKGPVFANIVMVDELNRASPKTQSALLEVMQERQVTVEGVTRPLEMPFIVIATQIPYGSPGTYPLTEVQIDRFAFKIEVKPPTEDEEVEILSQINEIEDSDVKVILDPRRIRNIIAKAKKIHVSDKVRSYIVALLNQVRSDERIRYDPSPRASIWLLKASRAKALLEGRGYIIPDDVKELSHYVLQHRIVLTPESEVSGETISKVIEKALELTPVPKE